MCDLQTARVCEKGESGDRGDHEQSEKCQQHENQHDAAVSVEGLRDFPENNFIGLGLLKQACMNSQPRR